MYWFISNMLSVCCSFMACFVKWTITVCTYPLYMSHLQPWNTFLFPTVKIALKGKHFNWSGHLGGQNSTTDGTQERKLTGVLQKFVWMMRKCVWSEKKYLRRINVNESVNIINVLNFKHLSYLMIFLSKYVLNFIHII